MGNDAVSLELLISLYDTDLSSFYIYSELCLLSHMIFHLYF